MIVVVKIGTSSLTESSGEVNENAIIKLCSEVGDVRAGGDDVIIVTSGAITAGLPFLGWNGRRPKDTITLQAAAAVGQSRLLRSYDDALAPMGIVGGQILVTPDDFFYRNQYLHVRQTLQRLLQMGVVPIVNENDAVADDEIRFSDNDRLAALVGHAVGAELLVLLTDTSGLFTADPRLDATASLVEEITEINHVLEKAAGAPGTDRGSGGMASKLAASRMASWSGMRAVIAAASRLNVLPDAVSGNAGVGTVVHPHGDRLSARKLWIAFAKPASGRVIVDEGARDALVDQGGSLLPAGVVKVEGDFLAGSGIEVGGPGDSIFAKGLTAYSSEQLQEATGRKSIELPKEFPREVVHRDDLVVLV